MNQQLNIFIHLTLILTVFIGKSVYGPNMWRPKWSDQWLRDKSSSVLTLEEVKKS